LKLEGFLSLLGCVIMLIVLIVFFTELVWHAHESTAALHIPVSSH